MFYGHCTLHADIAGYLDRMEEVCKVDAGSPQLTLRLAGWAFHWRWAARPVRYCRRLEGSGDDDDDAVIRVPLTMLPRPDVYDFYERHAVLCCGWDQRILLPAAADSSSVPEQWLELELRDGQWVKFMDLAMPTATTTCAMREK